MGSFVGPLFSPFSPSFAVMKATVSATLTLYTRASGAWRGRKKLGSSWEPGLQPAADASAFRSRSNQLFLGNKSRSSVAAANIDGFRPQPERLWCPRGHQCLARSGTYTQIARSSPLIAESCSSFPNRKRFRRRYLSPEI